MRLTNKRGGGGGGGGGGGNKEPVVTTFLCVVQGVDMIFQRLLEDMEKGPVNDQCLLL